MRVPTYSLETLMHNDDYTPSYTRAIEYIARSNTIDASKITQRLVLAQLVIIVSCCVEHWPESRLLTITLVNLFAAITAAAIEWVKHKPVRGPENFGAVSRSRK